MKRLLFGALVVALCGLASVVAPHPDAQAQEKQDKKAPEKHPRGRVADPLKVAGRHAAALKRLDHAMKALPKITAPTYDVEQVGYTLPVEDQGNCGSCYLVSSCEVATMALVHAGVGPGDGSFFLSPQYGLDCQNFGGCGGGDEAEVIDFIKKNGMPLEKDYGSYNASEGRCKFSNQTLYKIRDWGYCAGNQGNVATVDEIKSAMVKYGPISIAASADGWDSYNGGVFTITSRNVDHAIKLTGWDDSKKAFRLKNQWGKGWGDGGYMWVSYDSYIVEAIWVDGGSPVPPPTPPVPPVPPGPGPTPTGRVVSVMMTYDDGQTQVLPNPNSMVITRDTTIEEIMAAIKAGKFDKAPTLAQPLVPSLEDRRWKEQEQVNKALLLGFKDIASELKKIKEELKPPMKP